MKSGEQRIMPVTTPAVEYPGDHGIQKEGKKNERIR